MEETDSADVSETLFQTMEGGKTITEMPDGEELDTVVGVETAPLIGATIEQGATVDGWIAFDYHHGDLETYGVRLGAFPDNWSENEPEAIWDVESAEKIQLPE